MGVLITDTEKQSIITAQEYEFLYSGYESSRQNNIYKRKKKFTRFVIKITNFNFKKFLERRL